MTSRLKSLGALTARACTRIRERAHHAALVPFVALACHPAFAELPTLVTPTEGVNGTTVQNGDIIGQMGAIFKAIIGIVVLVIAGWFFLQAMMGLIGKWKDYSTGRAQISDMKEYFGMAMVSGVIIVALGTYAISTMG
ncbi:DUF2976 domain-containing protein [Pseudorhodoferax sp. LjRoot39]|uniref:integrating conjugative element membrane protein n=1 Tax=Pseudorhodoferax sp. LjRoot39 TaxID=3342328 RepID=UPI003ED03607